jgi:uncharacterized tellurite resistance protein B-like protein
MKNAFKDIFFNNLVQLALKDGEICDKEMAKLLEIAQQEDINTTTVKTCFAGASSLRFLKPETTREKIYILNGYLQIVEADGKITDEEKYACIQLCRDMDLDINYLDAVLTDKNLASLG